MGKMEEEFAKGLVSWVESYKVAKKYGNTRLMDELYFSIMEKAKEVGFSEMEIEVLTEMLADPVSEEY